MQAQKTLAGIILFTLSLIGCQSTPPTPSQAKRLPVPDRLVVLTLDDGTVSQYQAGALIKQFGFGATYFISDVDLKLPTPKMTWDHIRSLHEAGFEIASHTCVHPDLTKMSPQQINNELECLELRFVENHLPRPKTFAYPGYHDSPAIVDVLAQRGYLFARKGNHRPFVPGQDHPLLIPTCGDWGVPAGNRFPDPGHSLDYFKKSVTEAKNGKIVVLTFHGIPQLDDPDNSQFKIFLEYLRDNNYTVISMQDLATYVNPAGPA